MIVEVKAKSQVTIPKEVMTSLDIKQGDQLDLQVENGRIVLIPVIVYPEETIKSLKASIDDLKKQIDAGEVPVFDSVDAVFEELDKYDV